MLARCDTELDGLVHSGAPPGTRVPGRPHVVGEARPLDRGLCGQERRIVRAELRNELDLHLEDVHLDQRLDPVDERCEHGECLLDGLGRSQVDARPPERVERVERVAR